MDDEKPFELRDRIALEILNGIIGNSSKNNIAIQNLLFYINHPDRQVCDGSEKDFEQLIRSCYKVADIMRKVRLSTFE
jgi:hypothetical protein